MGLREDLASKLAGRTVVVGVGDAHKADDGAGPKMVEALADAGFLGVVDSGTTPELETWRIREMEPDSVLFVDAVDFGGEPGDVVVLKANDLRESGFDTHRAPLRLTMRYIELELGAACHLLAVQPKSVQHGLPMCAEVRRSVEDLARLLVEELLPGDGDCGPGEVIGETNG